MKRSDMTTENMLNVITACCILHNFYELHGNAFHDSWLNNNAGDEYKQPTSVATGGPSSSSEAHMIRNTLMEYLYQQHLQ